LKLIPAFIYKHIADRPHLLQILSNGGWLFLDKLIRMAGGLLVGVWVARYLGPEQFGLMSYALAITALFGSIAALGLPGIIVRDLLQKPEKAGVTLGTAFLLQLLGGLLAFLFSIAAISILRPADELSRMMVAILGFVWVFKASDVVKYWFESQVKSKYVVWIENGVFIFLAATRLALVISEAPIIAFLWAALAEAALTAFFLLRIYSRKAAALSCWQASLSEAKSLLNESWPLILASVASIINMRMDQIMLGTMVDDSVVGNYSAAVRLAEVWLMFPGIIGASVYPAIIAAKLQSEIQYRYRILQITKIMAACVIPMAIIISLLSDRITNLIYGQQFSSAGQYLAIYIWTGVPYLIFFVLNQMLHIEGLLKNVIAVSIFTVLVNLLLNYILIPRFGGVGAAFATLTTTSLSIMLYIIILELKTGIFFKKSSYFSN